MELWSGISKPACSRGCLGLGLLEVSPWGQSLTAGPSDCPAVCPSAPADWNPERVPGDTRAWESRGEDHDLQHAPVCCPLQQGFQAGQRAAAHLQGWQQAPGAGWGSALRVCVVIRSSGRSASSRLAPGLPWGRPELHQVAFGSPNSSEPLCPWLPPQVTSGWAAFFPLCVMGHGVWAAL